MSDNIKEKDAKRISDDENKENDEDNAKKEGSVNNEEIPDLKPGQYFLTTLEQILINKIVPRGYKLETEENILKSIEIAKQNPKKHKSKKSDNDFSNDNTSYISNKKSLRDRKPTTRDDLGFIDINSAKLKNDPKRAQALKKCEKIFNQLKSQKESSLFYHGISNSSSEPSLAAIEKSLNNLKYKTTEEFLNDLHKLWNYYFQNSFSNPDVYQKTFTMNELTDKLYKEVEEEPNPANGNSIISKGNYASDLNKKIDSISKNLKDFKGIASNNSSHRNLGSSGQSNSIMDKEMSLMEKTALGNSIKSLKGGQLKGIIDLLKDTCKIENGSRGFFEFDIDKLPPRKQRELEAYVNNCTKKANSGNNTRSDSEITRLKNGLGNANDTNAGSNNNQRAGQKAQQQRQEPPHPQSHVVDDISESDSDSSSMSSFK